MFHSLDLLPIAILTIKAEFGLKNNQKSVQIDSFAP